MTKSCFFTSCQLLKFLQADVSQAYSVVQYEIADKFGKGVKRCNLAMFMENKLRHKMSTWFAAIVVNKTRSVYL